MKDVNSVEIKERLKYHDRSVEKLSDSEATLNTNQKLKFINLGLGLSFVFIAAAVVLCLYLKWAIKSELARGNIFAAFALDGYLVVGFVGGGSCVLALVLWILKRRLDSKAKE